VDKTEKEKRISIINDEIQFLVKKKLSVEFGGNQIYCDDISRNEYNEDERLVIIENIIDSLKEQRANLISNVDTWSYTIMGNKRAEIFWWEFFQILLEHLTDEERAKHPVGLPRSLIKGLINSNYEELVQYTNRQNSRLTFQVLGVLLMEYGAKMTEGVRMLILKHSDWNYERAQLINAQDISDRRNFLFDYREKVKNYHGGFKVDVPIELLTDIMENNGENTIIDRQSIDFQIKF
jgi:hypothetical protein